ncbi:RING-type E3 ubiquitin transferase [Ranunculus cassubicifolius]
MDIGLRDREIFDQSSVRQSTVDWNAPPVFDVYSDESSREDLIVELSGNEDNGYLIAELLSKEEIGDLSAELSGNEDDDSAEENFPTSELEINEFTRALRKSFIESSKLIFGIAFTKRKVWHRSGRQSRCYRSTHATCDTQNSYEKVITTIEKAVAPFDNDNSIPCFGFGDDTTRDQEVFSFHRDRSCHGFEEVLSSYRRIVPNLRLSGRTSFGPIVEAAIDTVERSQGQYHVLVIIAERPVSRGNTSFGELSPQERHTINAIVTASSYPLSIILIGVGDGPWEGMQNFSDKIRSRGFDNFMFVNFTDIMSGNISENEKEAEFSFALIAEISIRYKASKDLNLHGNVTTKAKSKVPRPLPLYFPTWCQNLRPTSDVRPICPICMGNEKNLAFGCGHTVICHPLKFLNSRLPCGSNIVNWTAKCHVIP